VAAARSAESAALAPEAPIIPISLAAAAAPAAEAPIVAVSLAAAATAATAEAPIIPAARAFESTLRGGGVRVRVRVQTPMAEKRHLLVGKLWVVSSSCSWNFVDSWRLTGVGPLGTATKNCRMAGWWATPPQGVTSTLERGLSVSLAAAAAEVHFVPIPLAARQQATVRGSRRGKIQMLSHFMINVPIERRGGISHTNAPFRTLAHKKTVG